MHISLAHLVLGLTVWFLLAVALGIKLGKAIAHADAIEQPQPEQLDTQVIDWADRPAAWL